MAAIEMNSHTSYHEGFEEIALRPKIDPIMYFNMEMVEAHYLRDETCLEKYNILLKLCAVVSCCTFTLLCITGGR